MSLQEILRNHTRAVRQLLTKQISPMDMSTVYNNITTMTFNGFVLDLYTIFGMPKQCVRKMRQSDHSKPKNDMDPSRG